MGVGWRQKAAQNRAKQSNPRGKKKKAGAGELEAATASPVARMGGGRRPVAGSKQQHEEGEEKRSRRRGGHTGRQGKQKEGKQKVLGLISFWVDFFICFSF